MKKIDKQDLQEQIVKLSQELQKTKRLLEDEIEMLNKKADLNKNFVLNNDDNFTNFKEARKKVYDDLRTEISGLHNRLNKQMRYPMCKDQPAQIDCRITDCKWHKNGSCTNVSPAIKLNSQNNAYCYSYEDGYEIIDKVYCPFVKYYHPINIF